MAAQYPSGELDYSPGKVYGPYPLTFWRKSSTRNWAPSSPQPCSTNFSEEKLMTWLRAFFAGCPIFMPPQLAKQLDNDAKR